LNINIENSSISVSELIRICNNSIESSETELQLVKELLEHANISGYEVSYPTENYPNTFYLKHITPSNCPL
ncbi:14837_t:CDS:1, partial [Gigaspora rosea]